MAPLDGNENCIGKKQRYHIVCCGGKYMIVYLNMLDILNFFNNLVDDQECQNKRFYEVALLDNIEVVNYYKILQ